ncbi:MAG: DUF6531 domain-containing protein, partial [Pseudomonadota bacterium]
MSKNANNRILAVVSLRISAFAFQTSIKAFGCIFPIAFAALVSASPQSAFAQTETPRGVYFEPVYKHAEQDDGTIYTNAVEACEVSWRSFNGNGPYSINNINLASGLVGCEFLTSYAGGYRTSNSNGGFGTGGFANRRCGVDENGDPLQDDGDRCVPVRFQPVAQCEMEGNPIEIGTGDKFEVVVDYAMPGPKPFAISRTYRSDAPTPGKSGLP